MESIIDTSALKQRFLEIYKQNIKREGADKLLEYLLSSKSDFFTAPASTRYHGSYEGGLLEHSLNVYDCLCDYLTAPTMLYFESCFDETRRIQDPEKTKAFAEIFRDLPLIPVAKEEPVHAGRDQYGFMSVIGSLIFYEYDGSTYICLSLSGDYAEFRVE